ncbi:hypothetical protein DSO57_1020061 [Entomophthora muscae]|uniref:Uncharacterized protein n=1 Tax=Entomophthora muscae TaxID=34485 RepID=A0ACC2TQR0_9FUNG|nr:hypothetical protein DSO57_1020061 [Entomophthora muscae]
MIEDIKEVLKKCKVCENYVCSKATVMNDISILVLKTRESNPVPLKTTQVTQDEWEPTKLVNHRLEFLNCSVTRQPVKGDSPNLHQIATNLVPLKTQDGWGRAKPVNHKLKLLNYYTTCQPVKRDSLFVHQIAANLVPLKI